MLESSRSCCLLTCLVIACNLVITRQLFQVVNSLEGRNFAWGESEVPIAVLLREDRRSTRLESNDWPVWLQYAGVTDPPSSPTMTIASMPAQLTNCKSASSSIRAVHSDHTDSQDLVALHNYLFGGSAAPRGRCVFSMDRNALCCCALVLVPPSTRVCSCRRRRRCLCRPAPSLSLAILPFITQKRNAARDESELATRGFPFALALPGRPSTHFTTSRSSITFTHCPPLFYYFSVKAGSSGRLGYSFLPDNPSSSRPAVHLAVKSVWLFFHDLP